MSDKFSYLDNAAQANELNLNEHKVSINSDYFDRQEIENAINLSLIGLKCLNGHCDNQAAYCDEEQDNRIWEKCYRRLQESERESYAHIQSEWEKLFTEMISIERDLLLMKEKSEFIYLNSQGSRLTDASVKKIEYLKQEIKMNFNNALKHSKETFDGKTYELISSCLSSMKKNIRELSKEVSLSTDDKNQASICRGKEEVKHISDESITQEVLSKVNNTSTIYAQPRGKFTKPQEDIVALHKECSEEKKGKSLASARALVCLFTLLWVWYRMSFAILSESSSGSKHHKLNESMISSLMLPAYLRNGA